MVNCRHIVEFGDFQTPLPLAREICRFLADKISPRSVVEPTCGTGNFVLASLEAFPSLVRVFASDINESHLDKMREALSSAPSDAEVEISQADFFVTDWNAICAKLPKPLLILGNPPWVTNSELGTLGSGNLPPKSNFQKRAGFSAMTGKSNFDISEWMLLRLLESLKTEEGLIAMLCKSAVARKVLVHAAKTASPLRKFACYRIDAMEHFRAAVEAVLFVAPATRNSSRSYDCRIFSGFDTKKCEQAIGVRGNILVSDIRRFTKLRRFVSYGESLWRSGIKHDCSKVMELIPENGGFKNGLGETVDIEDDFLYPLVKSSDLANWPRAPRRFMLVPQTALDEDTRRIEKIAPKTWQYLRSHSSLLDKRTSSIYRRRPPFSVFGVGPYSFTDWKVAVSGFYKQFAFRVVGPYSGKPIVFDDTCYFSPCENEEEASLVDQLLASRSAQDFLESIVFWDNKRPITKEVLDRLSLRFLAEELKIRLDIDSLRILGTGRPAVQSELRLSQGSVTS